MQQSLLGLIGERLGDLVGAALDHVEADGGTGFAFEIAGFGVGLRRIAIDVEGRRIIEMNAERRHVAEFGEQHRVQNGVDLALQRIGARRHNAVAIGG